MKTLETKWTPGPWEVQAQDERWVVVSAVTGKPITGWGNVRQLSPDAELIAAAPELYEVLEEAMDAMVGKVESKHPIWAKGARALAHARGGKDAC